MNVCLTTFMYGLRMHARLLVHMICAQRSEEGREGVSPLRLTNKGSFAEGSEEELDPCARH